MDTAPAPIPGALLITGASRGIGAATALAAADAGHDLIIHYAHDPAAADGVVEQIQARGRRAVALKADLAQAEDIRRLFARAHDAMGPIAGLVNNAGVTGPLGPFARVDDATLEHVFAVNTVGAMRCAREALAQFRTHQLPGVIVNVSSVAARTGSPHEYVHYAASKAALEAFTLGLGKEVAAEGIRVCGLAPGSTLTGIHAAAGDPGRPARIAPKIPMGRLAEPEEIAHAIVWLLSPQASYVTATTMLCAGGL